MQPFLMYLHKIISLISSRVGCENDDDIEAVHLPLQT